MGYTHEVLSRLELSLRGSGVRDLRRRQMFCNAESVLQTTDRTRTKYKHTVYCMHGYTYTHTYRYVYSCTRTVLRPFPLSRELA